MGSIGDAVSIYELPWDTEFFGVSSAKAILQKPLAFNEWNELNNKFKDFQFISIVNNNSEPVNSQLIGKDTNAFLADINIQFEKKLTEPTQLPTNITIHQSLELNEQIIEIADFKYSKFTEDPNLEKRRGDKVYHQWLMNAFKKPDKFFALSMSDNNVIGGFVLYSHSGSSCVIELIAVSQNVTKGGIGTNLFRAVESDAFQKGLKEIKVGTQVRNMGAINFYHKVGCRQVGCHQVYHLWNF